MLPAIDSSNLSIGESLPEMRRLSKLGSTCFLNVVVVERDICIDFLRESSAQGAKFQLPGGLLKLKDGPVTEQWGLSTHVLTEPRSELQSV